MGSISGQGTKILHAVQCSLKEEEEKETGDYFHALKKKIWFTEAPNTDPAALARTRSSELVLGEGWGSLGAPTFLPS